MIFRISPAVSRYGELQYYIEVQRFLLWRKLYITRGSNIGYNIKEIKYFDTPRKAYEYIQETYGTSACIVGNHL